MVVPLQKVTAFILRTGFPPGSFLTPNGVEMLLFQHPYAGIQIPAGSMEEGETPEVAVLREAAEETGLTGLTIRRYLGHQAIHLPKGQAYLLESTPIFARPDASSSDWANLRRGLTVEVLRQAEGFMLVAYKEFDQEPERQYLTYCILGWTPEKMLTTAQVRHFFLLDCRESTGASWTQQADQHTFTLFWAPLSNLPEIIAPQNTWLAVLRKALAEQG